MEIKNRDLGAKQTSYWSMFSFQELDPYQESHENRGLVSNNSWIRRGSEFLLTSLILISQTYSTASIGRYMVYDIENHIMKTKDDS